VRVSASFLISPKACAASAFVTSAQGSILEVSALAVVVLPEFVCLDAGVEEEEPGVSVGEFVPQAIIRNSRHDAANIDNPPDCFIG
jgi:hypothetical protein